VLAAVISAQVGKGTPMPRTVTVALPSHRSDELCSRLQKLDGMLPLRLQRGISLQPEGDVVEAEVLDRQLETVMGLLDDAGLGDDAAISVTTSAPASVVTAGKMSAVVRDTSTSRQSSSHCAGASGAADSHDAVALRPVDRPLSGGAARLASTADPAGA
jgi:hypothetical protein